MSVPDVTLKRIARLWWPLAASWMLMGAEMPIFAAVVARMTDPKVHLAAYGSLVFPISLLVEAPIIMLLATSTALCKDRESYRKLRRFMMAAGGALTVIHVAIAFTPVYDWIAEGVIGAPAEVIEPGRIGLRIMTPWSWAIAYRRFHQGILIRCEHSSLIGKGTLVRMITNVSVLFAGLYHGGFSGIVVGTSAVAAGVIVEAIFIGLVSRVVIREQLLPLPLDPEPLTLARFRSFYLPLALTPFLTLAAQPITAAALSRMPSALDSLAAWPAVYGLVFVTRALGFAYSEVVVALAGEPGSLPALRRFTLLIAGTTVLVLLLLAATPLSDVWFGTISALPERLTNLSRVALALAVLIPGYTAIQNAYQGLLVQAGRTRGITEAVALYLFVTSAALFAGVRWSPTTGLFYAMGAITLGGLAQTAWLWWRSRPLLDTVTS